jgi:hypothetical protein
MLLETIFDKTAFVKFKILNFNKTLMKHIQNNRNPKNNPCQPLDLKISRKKIREPKVLRLLPNVCDFQNKTIP